MKYLYFVIFVFISSSFFAQSITQKELKKHISYLASDDLKGRKPGTEGDQLAAAYIQKEFKKAGLSLMGTHGFQQFNLITGIEQGPNNHLFINGISAKLLEDNIPFPFSGNGSITSKVVFVGYGFDIHTDKIDWNDYLDIDVQGKWVLILRGDPEFNDRQSAFIPYSSDLSKVMTAVKKGAAGVLFVSGEVFDKNDKLVELKYGRGNAQVSIPVLHIKRNLADTILNVAVSILDFEKKINEAKTSYSFETSSLVKAEVDIKYIETPTQNIIGFIPGNDKSLAHEYILIGAHYDHLGMGGKNSGSRMPDTLAVHNGADDNASGVASLLEIADRLKDEKVKPARSIVFIAFGGEEMGLLGSSYFVNHPLIDLKKVYTMINLDMVGRLNKDKEVTIAGTGTSAEFNAILDAYKPKTDLKLSYSPGGSGASDHSSFYRVNIPVLFFNTGAHEDYHTPFDDTESINFDGQESITNLIFDIFMALQARNEKLNFTETEMPESQKSSRNFKVTLGIMPGFGDTSNKGLRVDGVTKGGPAEIGEMKRGDIITAINGEKIANIYEYMEILGTLETGQRIMVDILREAQKVVLTIQL